MRIGIDASRAVVAQRTGTEGYSWHLLQELPRLGALHELVYYFNAPPAPGDFPPSSRLRQRIMPLPRLWTHGRLAWEMALHPPDALFVPAHVLPWLHPRRSVVTVCDLGYLYYPQAHPRLRRLYLHWGTLCSARAARLVIAISEATKRDLVERYRIPAEKVRVVHLAADPSFRPDIDLAAVQAVRDRYGLAARYFLFVGTLHPRKNLECLLEAMALVTARHRAPLELVVAGKPGWQGDALMRQASGLPVRFLGYVPQDDLPLLTAGALALTFPSFYEGFGLPALEAMACGTPVIAADASSLPEVVGDAGLLADPHRPEAWAEAMVCLAEDEGRRAELRRRGLERARQFSWHRCAVETMAVLEEALRL
ncbi:MAG: glycosyltransferase family 4 protein [Bacteroidetes bacterium]|nr:glycosyltransferase family 4 protein [Bacteroidota bacterium]